ncbi:hypothetical protein CAOG_009712 [Capsaspora owczarzaki ATCC 30864]|uniref:Ras-GEF domain-containing protein n=1 Tax=Capsaspora owczarzaki (strain ATCC 30864) TaxID=595528 RepID=A0A0D2WQ03_CAPO3|nr:hypothetical protein CAOG_009712 [Capsaspora owczarzaki ATCC 30864]
MAVPSSSPATAVAPCQYHSRQQQQQQTRAAQRQPSSTKPALAARAAASTTSTGTGGSPNSGRKFLFRANTSKGRKSSAGALDLTSGSGTARSKDFIPGTTPAATMDFESLPRIVAPGAEFTYTNPETQITYRTDRDEVLVMTATFERLIDCMTEDIDKDVDYSDTFFLTYKSFLKPIVLFEALVAKFKGTGNAGAAAQIAAAGPDGQPPLQSAGSVESVSDASATMTSAVGGSQTDIFGMSATGSSTLKLKSSTRPKVLTMILHWMKHHWMDVEEDPVLQEQVHTFLNGLREGEYTAYYQSINNAVQQQRQRWEERKLQGEDASELLKRTSTKLSKMLPKIVIEMEPKELAEQLTYYDHHIFSRISRNDYINYLWPSKSRKEQLKASTNQTGTSHLDAFVNRLEKETFWIATEICSLSENETLKEQAKLIQLFLQALSHCLALDNIYTCFAIYGALNFQPVQKLKKAWELVPKKYLAPLQEVENLMNPSRNMRAYRTFIHQKEKTTTPLLPFLPLHLKDLVFLNDGNDTFFQDGRVNFDKCRTIARRVDWLDKLANRPYSWIVPKPELQSYLESAYVCPNMDELTKLARKNNPPPPAPASSSSTMKP